MIDESKERWRPVRDFEGFYEVSNMGRIRSLARWVSARDGKRLIEGKVIDGSKSRAGYQKVELCAGPNRRYCMIHQAVAEAFVPGNGVLVRHLDGDPSNNCAENLAWGSFKDNEDDKRRHGRVPVGERHPNAKLNDQVVRSIRRMSDQGFSQLRIAKELGLNRGVVGVVVRREGWTHVS